MDPPRSKAARDEALRLLVRRPRTREELSRELQRLGYGSAKVEATLAALETSGYLNDAELALEFITARASRLGHGRLRLLADLERRGVSSAVAQRAWNLAVERGQVTLSELLRRAVRRRLPGLVELDSKRYARVYNALLRAGYDGEEIRRELEPYRADHPFDPTHDDETNDEFP